MERVQLKKKKTLSKRPIAKGSAKRSSNSDISRKTIPRWQKDAKGRFLPGNDGGPGNPIALKRWKWRAEIHKYLEKNSKAVKQAIDNLCQAAAMGDLDATKVLFERMMGRPQLEQIMEPAQLEEQDRLMRDKAKLSMKLNSPAPKRKPVLGDKLIDDVHFYLKEGLPVDGVCDLLGISRDDFTKWLKTGSRWEDSEDANRHQRLCVSLLLSFRSATAKYNLRMAKKAEEDTQGINILERRDRSTWSKEYTEQEDSYQPDERYL